MIRIAGLTCAYGRVTAVRDVSLRVNAGEIVCLIGANGAGKTTLMRTVSGLHMPGSGKVLFEDADITRANPTERVRLGLIHVPEGRRVFGSLTVEENLQLGGITTNAKERAKRTANAYDLFPILFDRRLAQAKSLSGGEQQMLAIGRALMAGPRLLLMDEPSLGLAPKVTAEIFTLIKHLNHQGTSVLLVEQNAVAALQISHRAYVMESGGISHSGDAKALQSDPAIKAAYLGG
ncbi:MAG: ABC transporter ATP-binding protein [Alphaproteobacteria bacterium]|nr:ABC transporter ATP-binding protein [Alphaproteobacteria bacterium]MBO6863259.1 ABC transporter ATP-binding protein [Alphaproteobacteria bacterium]